MTPTSPTNYDPDNHEVVISDPEHFAIYGAVLDIRSQMIDLKQHVNDELEVQKDALAAKADKSDLTLFVLWKQSPLWLKIVGALVTASTVIGTIVSQRLGV